MTITIDFPAEMERRLRAERVDIQGEAKEAVFVELYRQDKISHYELSQALGLSRLQTDGVLKKHGVTQDLPTEDEIREDLQWFRENAGT